MSDEKNLRNDLFQLTMQKKWDKVAQKYEDSRVHTMKLTKSGDTAFHIAIAGYNSKNPSSSHAHNILKMIKSMENCSTICNVLSMKNEKGDTPLHIAAAVGWDAICTRIAKPDLIKIRNGKGETPLFIAAHHGNLEAFRALHESYTQGKEADYSLCRRVQDGNTVLHLAISGEYFGLAHLIIQHYRNLISFVNVDGETPLHVLARKPNLFRSSSHYGLYESFIYKCVFVDDLKLPNHNQKVIKNDSIKEKFPKNYWTCLAIFFLLWDPIYKSCKAAAASADEENQPPYVEHGIPICESFMGEYLSLNYFDKWSIAFQKLTGCLICPFSSPASCSRSKKQNENLENPVSDKGSKEMIKYKAPLPPNYSTCFSLFKFAMKVALTVLGIGFRKIKKIQEKKVKHYHAMLILKEMLTESSYKYDDDGQEPQRDGDNVHIPHTPPIEETTSSTKDDSEFDLGACTNRKIPKQELCDFLVHGTMEKITDTKASKVMSRWSPSALSKPTARIHADLILETGYNGVGKDTALIVAAKMGIPEMVKEIIRAVPVAIEDQDSEGKNVVMLAAENRQTSVFEYLMQTNLPNYVFHHVDNEGNNILHLAAKLGEKKPWRIPGAALQMQWETKWFKHVKRSVPPLCFSHHNAKGETPREVFTQTHEQLVQSGNEWLVKTSESCSLIAALIATVAFATSATVPGGLDQSNGYPLLQGHRAFDIFSIASLVALCLSVTALIFFLAIITSRFEERDFKRDLPRKLLMGLSCLFTSIAAMLASFCAGHTFILREKLRIAMVPIYAVATIPVAFFVVAQLPLYFDLVRAAFIKVPLRSYKAFY